MLALRVADLPDHHNDPFDRLIVAQAQELRIPVVTADGQLSAYSVDVVPARGLLPDGRAVCRPVVDRMEGRGASTGGEVGRWAADLAIGITRGRTDRGS